MARCTASRHCRSRRPAARQSHWRSRPPPHLGGGLGDGWSKAVDLAMGVAVGCLAPLWECRAAQSCPEPPRVARRALRKRKGRAWARRGFRLTSLIASWPQVPVSVSGPGRAVGRLVEGVKRTLPGPTHDREQERATNTGFALAAAAWALAALRGLAASTSTRATTDTMRAGRFAAAHELRLCQVASSTFEEAERQKRPPAARHSGKDVRDNG